MTGTWTIFRREMGQYFTSPISYIIAGTLLILTGLYFNGDVAFSLTRKPINPSLIPDFMATALIFFGPLLTMRMLAEEQREGTMELLLTAPVNDNAIVIGKFLSAWLFYSLLLAITFSYQIIVARISNPDMAHTICAYIGIWLYGGAALAIGLMFSALTENQIVAAFLGIATLTFLYLGNVAGQIVTQPRFGACYPRNYVDSTLHRFFCIWHCACRRYCILRWHHCHYAVCCGTGR